MKPVFECKKDKKGEWRFKLIAVNGKVICVSEGYKTRVGCYLGIRSVKKNSQNAQTKWIK